MARRTVPFLCLTLFLGACGGEPPPALRTFDSGVVTPAPDAEFDSGVEAPDSGTLEPDAAPIEDAQPAVDTGPALDAMVNDPDAGAPDAAPDSGPAPDAAMPDSGPADTGLPPLPDTDGDSISDADEGAGQVDTDGDMTPDSSDTDSDGDGISDADEAGDSDTRTPPVDTDGDGTPDFRDLDSDGDGITDLIEGDSDPDSDLIPAYRDVDSDGDGIPDAVEGAADTDMDGTPNFLDQDSDGDTIRDDQDGTADPDRDGVPSYLDVDSDGDGLTDADEAGDANVNTPPRDADFDQVPNFLDTDSDNDSISDGDEGTGDADGDGVLNFLDIDSDNDSILDDVESGDTSTATPPRDSDMDGTPDFLDVDADGDTILDITEGVVDTDGDSTPDRLDLDSDGDGWTDAIEAGDADPITPPVDTDMDRSADYRDLDSDADTLADAAELGCAAGSTERRLADSDADGVIDPAEIAFMSDPCATSQIDDFFFVLPPNGPGANAPLEFTETAIDRADFVINVDTTGSMQGEIDNIRMTLRSTIIPQVSAVIPDSGFAVTSFDDFPIDPFGLARVGDVPFLLGTRVTTDPAAAQVAVDQLDTQSTGSGLDFPESGIESLYQIATGAGVSYPGGMVPPFDPNANRVPNVSDGTIGGVGFRDNALPVIVHVTDALSHTQANYLAVNPAIGAAATPATRASLDAIGARVVTIANGQRPVSDLVCRVRFPTFLVPTFFGAITPQGMDVDWFELVGAVGGQTVEVEVLGQGAASLLDPRIAVANATTIIAQHDDIDPTPDGFGGKVDPDSRLTVTLTGQGPFYVAITESADTMFDGTSGQSAGQYFATISVDGAEVLPVEIGCRVEDSNGRNNATRLVPFSQTQAPASVSQCIAQCETILGPISPFFEDFTHAYEMSEDTRAVIPACGWGAFGTPRPAACAAGQCCTGRNGQGVRTNFDGMCPLSFEIDPTGVGIDAAMVAGIEALVRFSTFTVTTVVRPDPAQLAATGLDTSCFIHGVIPQSAVPPNSCAPTPTTADLVPPNPELDSFLNVVPGTALTFQVNALNQQEGTAVPCVASGPQPQLFRAFIDVVGDSVTVLDTRDVVIIVPPTPPGGTN